MTALGVGCGSSGNGTDGGTGTDVVTSAPQTLVYVLRTLTIDTTAGMISDSPDVPHTGFNLDNMISGATDPGGCNHEDFFSRIDPDQNNSPTCSAATGCGGVDNQLPTLAGSLAGVMPDLNLNQTVADTINAGRLSLILRVTDVNDLTNDTSVNVQLFLGYPTFSDCGQLFSGSGEYVISQSSLTAGGTGPEQATFAFPGSIVNGRLRVQTTPTATFPLPLPPVMGVNLRLNLHTPQLRMSLTAAGGTDGNLGGWVAGQDLVQAVVAAAPSYEMAARMIIGGLVDVQVGGVCTEGTGASTTYGGVSMGLGLTLVPARLSTMAPAAAQAANTCGYQAPGGG